MPGTAIGLALNHGFPGDFARNGRYEIDGTRPVNSTTALNPNMTPIYFGDACFLIPDATGGSRMSTQGLVVANGTVTGTASSGSNALTLSSATGVATGQVVIGAGIPIGTTISALSGTSATLSANTTAALSGTTLTIASQYLTYQYFAGFAIREVKSMETYIQPGTNSSAVNAYYAPNTAVGVFKLGNISLLCNVGSPLPGGSVFLRLALNSAIPAGVIGGLEAAADGTNTIQLNNCKWWGVPKDANNVCEVEITYINQV